MGEQPVFDWGEVDGQPAALDAAVEQINAHAAEFDGAITPRALAPGFSAYPIFLHVNQTNLLSFLPDCRVTASQYDVKTGEWTMSKLPVHHIIE